MTAPLARRRRARSAQPPAGRGERCEMCAEPIARRAPARGRPRQPRPAVHLPRLLPAVHQRGRRAGGYRAVPERYLSVPGFRLGRRSGTSWRSRSAMAFFFANSVAGPDGRVLPEPGGRHRVASWPWRPGTGSLADNPRSADAARRTSRRCLVHRRGRARFRVLSRPDRRLLRAGRAAAPALAGVRRRPEARAAHRRLLRRGCGTRRPHAGTRGWRDADLTFACRRRRGPSRTPRHPTLSVQLRHRGPAAGPRVHAIALRCQIRIEPQRRRVHGRRRPSGCSTCSATRARWADTLKPFLWPQCAAMVPGFTGATEVELPCRAPTTSRWPRPATCTAWTTATIPLLLLFSGTVFTRAPSRASRSSRCRGTREAAYRLPVARLAGARWTRTSPAAAGCGCSRDTLDALRAYKAGARCPPGTPR